jgi:hypothetical protein
MSVYDDFTFITSSCGNQDLPFVKYGFLQSQTTEHRGCVINAHVLYTRGPGVKPRPEDRLSWLGRDFRGFPQSLQATTGIIP